ncbi:MAG: hypothetical protein HY057_03950 [Rhodospirillales bacterium]|nr:hypothetical protein [Rhodospirillales bacterium]
MLKSTLIATALVAAFATPAFAFHCPVDMKAIDAELAKNPQLSAADMAKVKELRAEGETHHKAASHQKSVDALAEAKKILKIQ